eukprot:TRINITY_DN288_c0_g1_i2.p1 TRINITY_DN288_c0_g1~~TRINITY_DN288_c0_g1_i2.p1  ORF type:complete len:279 (-),score=35.06 TRINITY_DN288_c0_g1_i2:508-1224(-)
MGSLVPGWDQENLGEKPYGMKEFKETHSESLPWWLQGKKDAVGLQDTLAKEEHEQQQLSRSYSGRAGSLERTSIDVGRPSLERRSSKERRPSLERKSAGKPSLSRPSLERKSAGKPSLSRHSGSPKKGSSFSQVDEIIRAAEEATEEHDAEKVIQFDMETDEQGKVRYQWWRRMGSSFLNEKPDNTDNYRTGSYKPQFDVAGGFNIGHFKQGEGKENQDENKPLEPQGKDQQPPLILI